MNSQTVEKVNNDNYFETKGVLDHCFAAVQICEVQLLAE